MRSHLYIRGIAIRGRGVDVFDVPLRSVFTIKLMEAPRGVRWLAESDPVLSYVEAPDRLSAEFTATAVGTSIVYLVVNRGQHMVRLGTLTIKVVEEETTKVGAEFGNVRPRPKP